MEIKIKATNIELLPGLNKEINEKLMTLERFIKRYGSACFLEVELAKTTLHHGQGKIYRAELKLNIPRRNLYAAADENDLKTAIIKARNQLKIQIIKDKTRRQNNFSRDFKEREI